MGLSDSSLFKSVIRILVIFVAAFGGIYLGMKVGGRSSMPIDDQNATVLSGTSHKLVAGMRFPDVTVVDETGAPVTTAQLLADNGGIIFFMELGCPPCVEMTRQWQQAITDGHAADIPSIGITINLPIHLHPYRVKNGLTFPLYSDTANTFMSSYDVTSYPYMVLVDQSGTIRFTTDDPRDIGNFDHLRELIQQ